MSAQHDAQTDPLVVANATAAFVKAFDAWMRRASVANAGESESRLRLLYELHCNGPRKMADLADTLSVTPRNITALVDGLEAESLVRRSPHPTDRRVERVEALVGDPRRDLSTEATRADVLVHDQRTPGAPHRRTDHVVIPGNERAQVEDLDGAPLLCERLRGFER